MKSTPTLFLHGGPGLSAIAERALYANSLPVHWWDQPRSAVLFARPYQALLDEVVFEAQRLVASTDGKINLLAHSFGARLALHLATVMPTRIEAVSLIAPVFDVADAFVRLGERLAMTEARADRLFDAITRCRDDRKSFEAFWCLVEAICDIPQFLDAYWGPHSELRRRWFYQTVIGQSWADLNTCEVVLRDFWNSPELSAAIDFTGPVKLIFGKHDVLVDPSSDAHRWSRHFPRATISCVDTGHFVQLEMAPETWMPSA